MPRSRSIVPILLRGALRRARRVFKPGIPGSTVTYAYTPDSLDAGYSVLTPSNAVLTRALTRDSLRRGLITSVSNLVNGADSGSSFDYTYDALGRPVARNLDEFGYNARGEVAWARYGTNTLSDIYDYDSIGNFTSNRLRGAWTQFDANALNEYEAITTPSTSLTTALAYDPDGNLLTNGVWSYAYDSMNRLSAAVSNGVAVAEYAYDAFWRRVGRRAGGAEHRTLYDDWNPVRESVSTDASTTVRDAHWGKDLSGTFQGAGGVGGLLAARRADGLFLPFYDNLGNVVAYADAEGSVVAAYAYDAFGRTASASGPLVATFAHGFSTKPLDPETGLHYYGYRFYDSEKGRWMNRDPINESGGVNVLCFVSNSPNMSIDPLGLAYGNPVVNQDGIPVGSGWGDLYSWEWKGRLFKCCNGIPYDSGQSCCTMTPRDTAPKIYGRNDAVLTTVSYCCMTDEVFYGISGHCFVMQNGRAIGFHPDTSVKYGLRHALFGGAKGLVQDEGYPNLRYMECKPIALFPCEYDIGRFEECVSRLWTSCPGLNPTYHSPFYDCRKWARHRIEECKRKAAR